MIFLAKTLTVKKIEDDSQWDEFVSESPQGTIFSKSFWVRTAADAQGGRPCFHGVFQEKRLVAGLSFVEISRGPLRKITTPVLTPHGGMLYRPGTGKRESEKESFNMACAEKIISCIATVYSYSFLVHSPGLTDIRPFIWAGWNESVRYTYMLELSDADRIWDLMERRVRTVLRNAESTLQLGGAIDIEHFGRLYERIYVDRRKKPPTDSKIVKLFLKNVLDSGIAEMRTVSDSDGDVLSAMVLVSDERTVYAWISGSVPEKNSTGAFTLLFWDAVKRYSGTCTELDMVGANIPPIAFFKKGFGGTLKPYYVTERYSSLFSRIVFSVYGKLRKVVRT